MLEVEFIFVESELMFTKSTTRDTEIFSNGLILTERFSQPSSAPLFQIFMEVVFVSPAY